MNYYLHYYYWGKERGLGFRVRSSGLRVMSLELRV